MENSLKYLRVSVTDKCNLRCKYCDNTSIDKLPPKAILSFEEICRIVRVAGEMGVETVRITGGEPLARTNIVDLFKMIKKDSNINDLTFTTNGVLLERFAEDIFKAGVRRFNISLDTLNANKFKELTGGDYLKNILGAIEKCKKIGYAPIKINAVILKDINDDEFIDFAEYAIANDVIVRFIELMDISGGGKFFKEHFMSVGDAQKVIRKRYDLVPSDHISAGIGPASYYNIAGTGALLGFISPVSSHFCDSCNRLRLTADGHIKSCLLRPGETNILSLIRQGENDDKLKETLKNIFQCREKARGNFLDRNNFRDMSQIGG